MTKNIPPSDGVPHDATLPDNDDAPTMVSLMDELGIVWRDIKTDNMDTETFNSYSGRVGAGLIVVGFALSGIQKYWGPVMWLTYVSLAFLVLSVGCLIFFLLTDGRTMVRELRKLDEDIFFGLGRNMERRFRLCADLRVRYSEEQISFAQAYLAETLAQLKPRVGSLVGPLEKIGIVPLIVSALITFVTTLHQKEIALYWYAGVAVAVFMYVMAFRFMETAYALQRATMLLQAVQTGRKPLSRDATASDQTMQRDAC
jgi:hypothetical protein